MDISEIVKLVEQRPWILVAAVLLGLVGRLVKDDIKSTPNVPPRLRVWLILLLGVVSGLAEKKWGPLLGGDATHPVSWLGGLVGGFVSSALAIVGHNVLVGSLRGGKEFPLPWLTKIGVSPGPGKPVSIPPKKDEEKDDAKKDDDVKKEEN